MRAYFDKVEAHQWGFGIFSYVEGNTRQIWVTIWRGALVIERKPKLERFNARDERDGSWVHVTDYIWKHVPSGKFVFVDETENFVGPYDSPEEANQAMHQYAETL